MELTSAQLDCLNDRLPPGFLLEPLESFETRRRKSELEQLELSAQFAAETPSRSVKQGDSELLSSRPSKMQVSEGFRKLFMILSKLKKHPRIHLFVENTSDISQTLSLDVIEGRLLREEYENGQQFAEDIRKMFSEVCESLPSAEKIEVTKELRSYFETLMRGHERIMLTLRKQQRVEQIARTRSMSDDQVQDLLKKIKSLEPKYVKGIYSIVRCDDMSCDEEELKRDILKLEASVARGLVQHVETCLQKSKQLPNPVVSVQPAASLEMPPVLLQNESCLPKVTQLRVDSFAPINAPIRQGLAGFHDILPRIPR